MNALKNIVLALTLTVAAVLPLSAHAFSWQTLNLWKENGANINFTAGNVGVGTTTPSTTLTINGTIMVGNGAEACNSGYAGGLRYNAGTSKMQYCNGSDWTDWGSASSEGTSLASLTTDVSLTSPSNAQVLSYNGSKWVNTAESDPKVGANTTGYLSKWNGSALVSSIMYETSSQIGLGIGAVTPSATLHMGGSILVGNGGETCDGSHAGALRYNSGTSEMQYCDGSSWTTGSSPYTLFDYDLFTNIAGVAAGRYHSCALTTGWSVYCWGLNSNGQLGNNTTTSSTTPVQVVGVGGSGTLSGISSVRTGENFSCALSSGGSVYCWGLGTYGRLGDNTATTRYYPVQVTGVGGSGTLSSISQIVTGNAHACALTTTGTVYCWGYNAYGLLGDNTLVDKNAPVQVKGVGASGNLTGISAISSEGIGIHTCALSTGGAVYCWGWNNNGQLGDNTTTNRSTPVQVKGVGGSGTLSGIASISAGYTHTCAVTTGGAVYCWGENAFGALGNGGVGAYQAAPVQVVGVGGSGTLSGISAVAAGQYYTCALSTGGDVYCWGYNVYGQVGDNTTTNRSSPVQMVGPGATGTFSGVSSLAAGQSHTCALTSTNLIYCWGYNNNSQLGDLTTTNRYYPVQVTGVGAYDTTNYLSKWNGSALILSRIQDNGTTTSIGGTLDATYALRVYGGGVGAAGAYTNTSDARLKKDVQTFSGALDKVRRLRGVTFTWKDPHNPEKGTQIGFIAQEVEKVIPEVVVTQNDGYKAMKYSNLTAVLVEAVKELDAKVSVSDAQVKAIDAQNALLRQMLSAQGKAPPPHPLSWRQSVQEWIFRVFHYSPSHNI